MSSETKITLSKGGTAEQEITMGELHVPDLYGTAETIRHRETIVNPEATADKILECWYICHDLKRYILEQK